MNKYERQLNELSVDDSKAKPYWCPDHGETYEPCWHWYMCTQCGEPNEACDCDNGIIPL